LRRLAYAALLALLVQPVQAQDMRSYLQPTLTLEPVDGVYVPLQNGVPYPSFTPQPASRVYIDLGGEWFMLYDPQAGEEKVDGVRVSLAARTTRVIEALERQRLRAEGQEGWARVTVPSCNNARGSSMEGYQGVAWYKRSLMVPPGLLEPGRRVRLVFHGVNYVADVWVNGAYVGYHEGGFTPFIFDVTELLRGGLNWVLVRVDNVPWDSPDSRYVTVPYKRCDWWNYGGIYRDVYLEIVNSTYIARLDLTPRAWEGLWNLTVRSVVAGRAGGEVELEVYVYPAGASGLDWEARPQAAQPDVVAHGKTRLDGDRDLRVVEMVFQGLTAREWSPEEPNLYVAHARLRVNGSVVDEVYEQFGFREVRAAGGKILLNGKPVFLKGVSRHEDYPSTGRTAKPSAIYQDLQAAKEVGANFLRTAHYPNHPLTYVYADRLGLAVWEEIPVYWFDCEALRLAAERGVARQMLLEMIYRDYNRPSIIIWSLANECGCRDERVALLRSLAEAARSVDPTRLLTQAIAWDPGDDTTVKAGLDVLAVNMYFGVFYGRIDDMDRAIKELHGRYPGVPILVSEFGYWSGGGVGETGQAEYFSRVWSIVRRNGGLLSGAAWWTLFDYDSMITFDTFGAIDWSRSHRKLLYHEMREAYKSPLDLEGEGSGEEAAMNCTLLIISSLAALLAVLLMSRRLKRRHSR